MFTKEYDLQKKKEKNDRFNHENYLNGVID